MLALIGRVTARLELAATWAALIGGATAIVLGPVLGVIHGSIADAAFFALFGLMAFAFVMACASGLAAHLDDKRRASSDVTAP